MSDRSDAVAGRESESRERDDAFEIRRFCIAYQKLIARLHRSANAHQWQLSEERFGEALHRSAARRFGGQAADREAVAKYLESLHVADLALAVACAAGSELAWNRFVQQFRPKLHAAAAAIAGPWNARELADSIYAELFGLEERSGRRRSLFEYFHGRSSLATWLGAVLSQRHADARRCATRLDSLDAGDAGAIRDERTLAPDLDRARLLQPMRLALAAALGSLTPRDRLRLSYYYARDLTLAQIGRLTGEHEATVSRKLARTRKAIRAEVERILRADHGLQDAEIQMCFEAAVEEWPYGLDMQETHGGSF